MVMHTYTHVRACTHMYLRTVGMYDIICKICTFDYIYTSDGKKAKLLYVK